MRIALILAAALPAFADSISVGVKVGTPLTDVVRTAGEIGGRPFQAQTEHFTIGPVLDIHLPLGLALEFGAMYKRFEQQAGQVQVIAEPGMPFQVQSSPYSRTGQSWEFPITGQYRFSGKIVRPYFEAGPSINHLSGVFAPFRTLVSQSAVLKPEGHSENRLGIVLGGGLEFKMPFLRVTPGLRYVRYSGAQLGWLPSANAVDFLVGLIF